ncbi:hypothetical protein [Spirosoma endbachense]|uniref:Lipoprotein n=1 Tax=Spirosoma endbachense TaxID=2666025 RepID=A0A6P1VPQ2_9BACT|nr:hypothetical protein [Spirosoma endbachense]QHV93950.1 hypothetical protein GJR95_02425 [Spirosoma endbachense]
MKMSLPMRPLALLALFALSILFDSCKKSDAPDDPTKGFTTQIQNIVPTTIIDDLRTRGMTINEGKVPPALAGTIIVASPWELLSPYGTEDSWQKGKVIADYKYKFYEQTTDGKIKYDYKNDGSDTGSGKGAFISGNGNSFTIFSEDIGVSKTINYKTITVMSGEITDAGIKNFQYAFVLKEKTNDDNNSALIPVGKGRIWIDSDKLATKTTSFRLAAQGEASPIVSMLTAN